MADERKRGGQKVGRNDPEHSEQHQTTHPATDKPFAEQVKEVKEEDRRRDEGGRGG